MKNLKIEFCKEKDKKELSNLIRLIFNKYKFLPIEFLVDCTEECSIGLYDIKLVENNKIIGFHFLHESKIRIYKDHSIKYKYKEDVSHLESKKGLEGFFMGIHPDFQRKGYGSALINFEKEYFKGKFDYIFGNQDARLNNINFWKKNRSVYCETFDAETGKLNGYKTIMYL